MEIEDGLFNIFAVFNELLGLVEMEGVNRLRGTRRPSEDVRPLFSPRNGPNEGLGNSFDSNCPSIELGSLVGPEDGSDEEVGFGALPQAMSSSKRSRSSSMPARAFSDMEERISK